MIYWAIGSIVFLGLLLAVAHELYQKSKSNDELFGEWDDLFDRNDLP